MKVTVDLPLEEIEEICKMAGTTKKGPAIRKILADSVMMAKRRKMAEKFMSGEWSVELEGFEESQEKDRQADREREDMWK